MSSAHSESRVSVGSNVEAVECPAAIPMLIMIVMPIWALSWQMFNSESGWLPKQNYLLLSIGLAVMGLQIWMVIEALLIWPRAKGVLEEALPPLPGKKLEAAVEGGRSC